MFISIITSSPLSIPKRLNHTTTNDTINPLPNFTVKTIIRPIMSEIKTISFTTNTARSRNRKEYQFNYKYITPINTITATITINSIVRNYLNLLVRVELRNGANVVCVCVSLLFSVK